ncbi:WecB/TagA/CpsF family glycosyltransferase [Candidatus Gracilibacteria bacterium]|nr:WecB/TagA/CpsF family glycosyltransferase [Candidatus Gracilibacteria bacterium]
MQFLGLDIYNGRYSEFMESIKNPIKKILVFTPNPEMLVRANSDVEFLDILKKADYNTPDANGLYVGSMIQEEIGFLRACFILLFAKKKLRVQYGDLIKGSDLTRDLFAYAEESGQRVLMIDNYRITTPTNPFEVEKMRIQSDLPNLFKMRFPSLDVTLVFDGEKTPEQIAELIIANNISYLFSCIGMKIQEKRLIEIFAHLPKAQRVVGLGVGASIDFLLGLQRRAPRVFQSLGLEWFYRLIMEPRRRWRRIYTAVIEFPMIVKNIDR